MRVMGIEALVPRPGTSKPRPAQDIPLPAARPEDCRAEPRVGGRRDLHPDGVHVPLSGAIIDWPAAVLAWRLSNTNDASFCAAALEEALLLGLARTCIKLKIPFFDYLGDRLAIPGPPVPHLATLLTPPPT